MPVSSRDRPRHGFTVVELLIVVVILGILVVIAVPQLKGSAEDARATSLHSNLAVLRKSVEYYKSQHNGRFPGYPPAGGAPTASEFVNQSTLATSVDGATSMHATAEFNRGPYIKEMIPYNPINGLNTVLIVEDGVTFPPANDATGWIFKPEVGKIRANSIGTAPSGTLYYDF